MVTVNADQIERTLQLSKEDLGPRRVTVPDILRQVWNEFAILGDPDRVLSVIPVVDDGRAVDPQPFRQEPRRPPRGGPNLEVAGERGIAGQQTDEPGQFDRPLLDLEAPFVKPAEVSYIFTPRALDLLDHRL